MRDLYKSVPPNSTLEGIIDWAIDVSKARLDDLSDFNIQATENPRIFSAPSSSTSTIGTEKVGDIAADSGFLYVVVDNAGDIEWRRVAISSF